MNYPWVREGMAVSMEKWDATERDWNKIGSPARVLKVESARSQSGYLVTVRGPSGKQVTLDMDWFDGWSE